MSKETKTSPQTTSTANIQFEDLGLNLDSLYSDRIDTVEGGATRSYDQLSADEKSKVDSMVEDLSQHLDPASISAFASSEIADIADFSGSVFDKCKIGDMEGFKDTMMAFKSQLESVDAKKLLPKENKSGILAKIPVFGSRIQASWDKKVEEYFQRTQTVSKFVDETIVSLGRVRLSVLEDIKMASSLKKKVYEYASQLELRILAVARVKERLMRTVAQMKEHANPNNLEEMSRIADIENAITRLDRKLYDLSSFRVISLNDISRLTFIENADQAVGEKIQDIQQNVVPQWKQQFAIAFYSYRLHGATAVITAVNQTTTDILLSGAKMTREAMTSSAREIEAPAIAMDTMIAVHEELKATVQEIIKIENDAKSMREKAIPEMRKLEQDIASLQARLPNIS